MDYVTRIGKRIEMFENAEGRGFCAHLYENLRHLCPFI
jgi:hypothetical protein